MQLCGCDQEPQLLCCAGEERRFCGAPTVFCYDLWRFYEAVFDETVCDFVPPAFIAGEFCKFVFQFCFVQGFVRFTDFLFFSS